MSDSSVYRTQPKNLYGSGIALFLLFFLPGCLKDKVQRNYKTEHIFVIVVDGPRYSETWGEPNQQYIPRMKNEMAAAGVVFTNFQNNGVTFTSPGHTALLTGVYQNINNAGGEKPQNPNFLNYWLKKSQADPKKAWIIASKDKIEILADSQNPQWSGKYVPATDCGNSGLGSGYRPDSITVKHILDTIQQHKPNLVFINFRQPDYNGHSGNWEDYLAAIRQADEDYYTLWKYIQTDPFYKNKTAFFVTNDHGRHLDEYGGFAHHGDECEGCRHINLYAFGPDFKQNMLVAKPYEQIDVPATIAEILHLDMPTANGKIIIDLFQDP